jgi:Carbamoyl-phosphate synthase small chain, CPSase domain
LSAFQVSEVLVVDCTLNVVVPKHCIATIKLTHLLITHHQGDPAVLYLKSGDDDNDSARCAISGFLFGAPVSVTGEVVINTGMVGYAASIRNQPSGSILAI